MVKAVFSASLLQSSVSHDCSEIGLICQFDAQQTFQIITNIENSYTATIIFLWKPWYILNVSLTKNKFKITIFICKKYKCLYYLWIFLFLPHFVHYLWKVTITQMKRMKENTRYWEKGREVKRGECRCTLERMKSKWTEALWEIKFIIRSVTMLHLLIFSLLPSVIYGAFSRSKMHQLSYHLNSLWNGCLMHTRLRIH